MWRCIDCDYYGEEVVENEDCENACPECGGECDQFTMMTEEEEEVIYNFIMNNTDKLISPHGKLSREEIEEDYTGAFLWEDFNAAQEIINQGNVFVYSVTTGDEDTAWLEKGKRFVNRFGYFLSRKEIELPEECVRYW